MQGNRLVVPVLILGLCIAGTNLAHAQVVAKGFILASEGRLGTNPEDTVEGERSIVGVYQGPKSYNQILMTDPKERPGRAARSPSRASSSPLTTTRFSGTSWERAGSRSTR